MIVRAIQNSFRDTDNATLLKIFLFLLLLGLFVVGVSAIVTHYITIQGTPLVDQIRHYRTLSLVVYFGYVILATIVVPLPTLPADIVFLGIFNPWKILAIRLIADLIGGAFAFYAARIFGKKLLKRWFRPSTYEQIVKASQHVSWKQYFWVTMFPLINTEVMAYAGGLSALNFVTVILTLFVGVSYRLLIVYLFIHI